MYFEKTYKINDNGKISGYHKRGKYEPDGSVKYFVNDSYGDQKALKETLKHNTDDIVENQFAQLLRPSPPGPKLNKVIPRPCQPLFDFDDETFLNEKFFDIPRIPKIDFPIPLPKIKPQDMDDISFINHCASKQKTEQQRKDAEYIARHKQIKNAIRAKLHEQLEANDTVHQITLDDFKFAVDNENKTHSSPEDIARWEELYKVYLPQ